MIIKFSWGGGCIAVDAELMILDLPMTNYKKWAKLFARYGEPADHEAFLQLLEDQIYSNEVQIRELDAEVYEFRMKADQLIPTELSVNYCLQQAALKQKHLNGAKLKLKRRVAMRDYLKGRLA